MPSLPHVHFDSEPRFVYKGKSFQLSRLRSGRCDQRREIRPRKRALQSDFGRRSQISHFYRGLTRANKCFRPRVIPHAARACGKPNLTRCLGRYWTPCSVRAGRFYSSCAKISRLSDWLGGVRSSLSAQKYPVLMCVCAQNIVGGRIIIGTSTAVYQAPGTHPQALGRVRP